MTVTPATLGVARALRAHRKTRGWTLAEAAALTGFAYSIQTLSKIETGHRSIDVDILYALADAYGCEPSDLLDAPFRSTRPGLLRRAS